MEAVAFLCNRFPSYTPSLRDYFSDQVTRIAQLLSQEREQKQALLEKGHQLAMTLRVIAENPIPLTDEAIAHVRSTLELIEEFLEEDGMDTMLYGNQREDLFTIYQDSAQALSLIQLQSALAAQQG